MNSLHLSLADADLLVEALDCYSRLCMGQLEIAEETIRHDLWRGDPDGLASHGAERGMEMAKAALGHPSGGSFGIRHETVDVSGKRAWEAMKAIRRALEIHREPDGGSWSVHRDGLTILRNTDDPEPTARVADGLLEISATQEQWEAVAKAVEVHAAVRSGDLGVVERLALEGVVRARADLGGYVGARELAEGDPALGELRRALAFAQDHVALAGEVGTAVAADLSGLRGAVLALSEGFPPKVP